MAALHDLIAQVEDPALRQRLEEELARLTRTRKFGLVFEDHLPELTPLPSAKVTKGATVARRDGPLTELWRVLSVTGGQARCVHRASGERREMAIADLVVVRQFGEPIFPSLVPMDRVENSPRPQAGEGPGERAAPWHTLIEADNYHALQLLEYLYAGQVDCIYIDPPYNSGARDWKYNNDYVDGNDAWRHSKWLAMMQRRLKLAKRLLNPDESVLIVTIDEKEYLRLGLLLEQLFPDGTIQMVSIVINRKGNPRRGEFSRCEEYIYFVRFGGASVYPWRSDMLHEFDDQSPTDVRWKSLLRLASTGQTEGRFNLFYPLFFDSKTFQFLRAGEPISEGVEIDSVDVPHGESVLWPISKDGSDGRWSLSVGKFNEYFEKGYVKFGSRNGGGRTPYYLMSGQLDALDRGDLQVVGRDEDGAVVLSKVTHQRQPMTIWNRPSHSTSGHGTTLLRDLLPRWKFPYPKSLYAVEDALRFFVSNKPDALVLDFFAGSGTTAHAVMRLNRQDGGRRQCISVTNNEVAADEQAALRKQGLHPGDPDWEQWGICRHITMPRLTAAITGKTPDGEPIKGDYKFTDEFPMAEGFPANLEYFRLDFLDKDQVALKRRFREILPILWLRAGAIGPRPELPKGAADPEWLAPEHNPFAVLLDEHRFGAFAEAIADRLPSPPAPLPGGEGRIPITHVFLVTDSEEAFREMAAQLKAPVVIQLYRDYLENFVINKGDGG